MVLKSIVVFGIVYMYIIYKYICSIFSKKVVTQTSTHRNPSRLFPCLTKPNGREEALLPVISRRLARCCFSRCDWNCLKKTSLKLVLKDNQGLETIINLLPVATLYSIFYKKISLSQTSILLGN